MTRVARRIAETVRNRYLRNLGRRAMIQAVRSRMQAVGSQNGQSSLAIWMSQNARNLRRRGLIPSVWPHIQVVTTPCAQEIAETAQSQHAHNRAHSGMTQVWRNQISMSSYLSARKNVVTKWIPLSRSPELVGMTQDAPNRTPRGVIPCGTRNAEASATRW